MPGHKKPKQCSDCPTMIRADCTRCRECSFKHRAKVQREVCRIRYRREPEGYEPTEEELNQTIREVMAKGKPHWWEAYNPKDPIDTVDRPKYVCPLSRRYRGHYF